MAYPEELLNQFFDMKKQMDEIAEILVSEHIVTIGQLEQLVKGLQEYRKYLRQHAEYETSDKIRELLVDVGIGVED